MRRIIPGIPLIGGHHVGHAIDRVGGDSIGHVDAIDGPVTNIDDVVAVADIQLVARIPVILEAQGPNVGEGARREVHLDDGVVFLQGDIGRRAIVANGHIFRLKGCGDVSTGARDPDAREIGSHKAIEGHGGHVGCGHGGRPSGNIDDTDGPSRIDRVIAARLPLIGHHHRVAIGRNRHGVGQRAHFDRGEEGAVGRLIESDVAVIGFGLGGNGHSHGVAGAMNRDAVDGAKICGRNAVDGRSDVSGDIKFFDEGGGRRRSQTIDVYAASLRIHHKGLSRGGIEIDDLCRGAIKSRVGVKAATQERQGNGGAGSIRPIGAGSARCPSRPCGTGCTGGTIIPLTASQGEAGTDHGGREAFHSEIHKGSFGWVGRDRPPPWSAEVKIS